MTAGPCAVGPASRYRHATRRPVGLRQVLVDHVPSWSEGLPREPTRPVWQAGAGNMEMAWSHAPAPSPAWSRHPGPQLPEASAGEMTVLGLGRGDHNGISADDQPLRAYQADPLAAGTLKSARPRNAGTLKDGFKAHLRLYLAAKRSVPCRAHRFAACPGEAHRDVETAIRPCAGGDGDAVGAARRGAAIRRKPGRPRGSCHRSGCRR